MKPVRCAAHNMREKDAPHYICKVVASWCAHYSPKERTTTFSRNTLSAMPERRITYEEFSDTNYSHLRFRNSVNSLLVVQLLATLSSSNLV